MNTKLLASDLHNSVDHDCDIESCEVLIAAFNALEKFQEDLQDLWATAKQS